MKLGESEDRERGRAEMASKVKVIDETEAVGAEIVKAAGETSIVAAPARKRHATVWNIQSAVQENYRRAVDMYDGGELSKAERLRTVGEIRQHLAFAAHLLQSFYTAAAAKEFIDEVLEVLNGIDPSLRDAVVDRWHKKRMGRALGTEGTGAGAGREDSEAFGSMDTDEG
jgi:hypothetical protein